MVQKLTEASSQVKLRCARVHDDTLRSRGEGGACTASNFLPQSAARYEQHFTSDDLIIDDYETR